MTALSMADYDLGYMETEGPTHQESDAAESNRQINGPSESSSHHELRSSRYDRILKQTTRMIEIQEHERTRENMSAEHDGS